ncbi:MAG: hypothetical protein WC879_07425 [Melioribacteraceae bacterium]
MEENDPITLLKPLFEKAQATEEFEFCCTILRVRGLESAGWDPLRESYVTMKQLLGEINSPIDDLFRLRLTLFLYCHATEIEDVYNIIANLLRICKNERFSMTPFMAELHSSKRPANYPHNKVLRIAEWATEGGFQAIGESMNFSLVKQVRNAFMHSDYIIHKDKFNISRGEGVLIDGVVTQSVPLQWLTPRLETGINFVLVTIQLIQEFMASYKEEKIVVRIIANGSSEKMKLTVDPNSGLNGFRSFTKEEREKEEVHSA